MGFSEKTVINTYQIIHHGFVAKSCAYSFGGVISELGGKRPIGKQSGDSLRKGRGVLTGNHIPIGAVFDGLGIPSNVSGDAREFGGHSLNQRIGKALAARG